MGRTGVSITPTLRPLPILLEAGSQGCPESQRPSAMSCQRPGLSGMLNMSKIRVDVMQLTDGKLEVEGQKERKPPAVVSLRSLWGQGRSPSARNGAL